MMAEEEEEVEVSQEVEVVKILSLFYSHFLLKEDALDGKCFESLGLSLHPLLAFIIRGQAQIRHLAIVSLHVLTPMLIGLSLWWAEV